MYPLNEKLAKVHNLGGNTYYVFDKPETHKNQENRPKKYADEKALTVYKGRGSNGTAKLLPEVHVEVDKMMTALLDYGNILGDKSIQSAVVQNGWRKPDDISQGTHYLDNIRMVLGRKDLGFSTLTFPKELEEEAKGMLGETNDPRWIKFVNDLGKAWGDVAKAKEFLRVVGGFYVPRGRFNPHGTGLVFDLNFDIYHHVYSNARKTLVEAHDPVDAHPSLNEAALRSALGMWLNTHSMKFNFDSYDTGKEIWHMEWRKPKAS